MSRIKFHKVQSSKAKKAKKHKRNRGHGNAFVEIRTDPWGGGPWHHSPPKVDSTGVPVYGRTIISQEIIELMRGRKRPSGLAKETAARDQSNASSEAKLEAEAIASTSQNNHHNRPLAAEARTVDLSQLKAVCELLHTRMNGATDLAVAVYYEMENGGKLTQQTARRLFTRCHALRKPGSDVAKTLCMIIFGRAPSKREALLGKLDTVRRS